jgi:hypothetical protein
MQAQEVQHQVPQDAIRLKLTRGFCAELSLLTLTLCVLAAVALFATSVTLNLPADGAR